MKKVNEEEKLKPICPDCIKTAVTLIMDLDNDWKEKIEKMKKRFNDKDWTNAKMIRKIIDEIAEIK